MPLLLEVQRVSSEILSCCIHVQKRDQLPRFIFLLLTEQRVMARILATSTEHISAWKLIGFLMPDHVPYADAFHTFMFRSMHFVFLNVWANGASHQLDEL
jgi:hypothetical protein